MKLFLSLLVMSLSVIGLYLLLKPASRPRKPAVKPKPVLPAPPAPGPLKASAPPTEQESVKKAVAEYADRFPRQTAQVLRSWLNKRD